MNILKIVLVALSGIAINFLYGGIFIIQKCYKCEMAYMLDEEMWFNIVFMCINLRYLSWFFLFCAWLLATFILLSSFTVSCTLLN